MTIDYDREKEIREQQGEDCATEMALAGQIDDYMEDQRRQREEGPDPEPPPEEECVCAPCTTPAYGHPGYAHCAACCMGTGISEYNHDCPEADHRYWAERQFPIANMIEP